MISLLIVGCILTITGLIRLLASMAMINKNISFIDIIMLLSGITILFVFERLK